MRDLFREPNAARAEDAALVVERDARAELDVFRLLHFVLEETRILPAVLDAEFLEAAFARLIADRAIERMIDEEKFHHPAPAFLDQRRIGAHPEAFGDIGRATDLRTRHPVDLRFAIVAEDGFAIGAHFRHAHFDQAHSAVAGGGELLVIAIARDKAAGLLAGLDQARAFGELVPDAVDLDVDHLRLRIVRHESGSQETRRSKADLLLIVRMVFAPDSLHDESRAGKI